MDVSRELKRFSGWEEDRALLDNFISNYDVYLQRLNSAKDHEDAFLLRKELLPVFDTLTKWHNDPKIEGYFKSKTELVRKLKELVNERCRISQQINGKRNQVTQKQSQSLEKVVSEQTGDKGKPVMHDNLAAQLSKVIAKSSGVNQSKIERGTYEVSKIAGGYGICVPSITELSDYFRNHGLIGDIPVSILSVFGVINQLCFGIESFSGAGKTVSLDILLSLFPQQDVYTLKLSSDKAILYDAESVSSKKIIVITELQKSANRNTIEALKDLGEGKSAERIVTSKDRQGIESQEILNLGEYKKAIIYTKAVENWFQKDRELERRYFVLSTDVSKKQTLGVICAIARTEFSQQKNICEDEERELKNHLAYCLHFQPEFVNPFAEAISHYLPVTLKTRTFIKHYFNLVKACTKFHHTIRARKAVDGNDALFVALQDIYYVHELYADQFVKSVFGIPFFGEKILGLFGKNSPAEKYDSEITSERTPLRAEDVYKTLKPEEPDVTYDFVKQNLNDLVEAGFLVKSAYEDRNPSYLLAEKNISDFRPVVDWKQVWESGLEKMRETYDPELVDKWIESQVFDGKLCAINPYTNEKIVLAKLSSKDSGSHD